MILAAYYGLSLTSENYLKELEEESETINWDPLWLYEARRKGGEKTDFVSRHILYYRVTEDGKASSVGFLIHKKVEESHPRIQ